MEDNLKKSWLMLVVKGKRQHGGNLGYDDIDDSYYSWDDTVPNHALPKIGDNILIWDKYKSIGISVIHKIKKK